MCMPVAWLIGGGVAVLSPVCSVLTSRPPVWHVYEIQGVGWFLAFVGALSSLFLCEVYKPFAKSGEQAALPVYEENTVLRVRV